MALELILFHSQKMEEILDPLEHSMIQYLPVSEFRNLCQTSKTFARFCDSHEIWRYFIQRDFGKSYQGPDPREEYIIKEKIRQFWESIHAKSSDVFWNLLDIVGYGLKGKFPFDYSPKTPEDDLATLRITVILCLLDRDQKRFVNQMSSLIYTSLENRILNTLFSYPQYRKFTKYLVANGIARGKLFYDQLDKDREFRVAFVTDPENIENRGSLLVPLFDSLYRFPSVDYCEELMNLEPNDPIIRNLD